jgi:hypothetical protein
VGFGEYLIIRCRFKLVDEKFKKDVGIRLLK